jgi:hypothetical protein
MIGGMFTRAGESYGTIPSGSRLKEKIMERIHMNQMRDLIQRLKMGESERRVAQDIQVSRPTIHKYHELAKQAGYLEKGAGIPNDETLQKVLGPGPKPPKIVSSLEPYGEVVKTLRNQEVEMVAIWQRLKEDYHYTGSYSAVRRYVAHLEPAPVEAYVRVHTPAGEEMQVDFGSVGPLYDPASGQTRTCPGYLSHPPGFLNVKQAKVVTIMGYHAALSLSFANLGTACFTAFSS